MMSDSASSSDIYNGAKCKSYSWSQSHSDLEIRVKLDRSVRYEDIEVVIGPSSIRVELDSEIGKYDGFSKKTMDQGYADIEDDVEVDDDDDLLNLLMKGRFEHAVDTDSAYWLLDNEVPSIVIYIDKAENMWWKQLLVDEVVTQPGTRNYTISMDHLDDGSRMVIDKLIVEQRNKLVNKDDHFSLA